MPRPVAVLCTWLALLASGCAVARPKPPSYGPDRPAGVRPARADGDYLLIRAGDRPAADCVLARRAVAAGDAVGFARDGAGVVAVAGRERVPLAEGTYRWKEVAPTGEGWSGPLADVGRRADPHLAAAGRLYLDALEPALGVVAAVGIVTALGAAIYGLGHHDAVGFTFR